MTGTSTIKSNSQHAIAIFAKNPKAGQVKTRLAKGTSPEFAVQFYKLCLKKITATFLKTQTSTPIKVYWTLPDNDTSENFPHFDIIKQGPGQLGDKLAFVQKQLFDIGHKRVSLVGSDSPHIDEAFYTEFYKQSLGNDSAFIGPTTDGGFYIFSTTIKTTKEFLSVKYSQDTTTSQLLKSLADSGVNPKSLDIGFDIDERKDLSTLEILLKTKSHPSFEDLKLLEHINSL